MALYSLSSCFFFVRSNFRIWNVIEEQSRMAINCPYKWHSNRSRFIFLQWWIWKNDFHVLNKICRVKNWRSIGYDPFPAPPHKNCSWGFPSSSSPHKLHQKGYETYQMADTFIGIPLHFWGNGLSSPSRAPVHHRDIRYSISAIRCYAFVFVSFSLTMCEFSSPYNHVLHWKLD